ncbi:unnamed protein product [Prorocentrum cordatum]|uniref:Uncharacterized protein n=1 Tax=Prorocentrum cordatum TaxID=2364126 RepID=A0ABN9SPE8_9DINO|nr:unnamed protein product [Polarella glacialis]
MRPFGPAKSTQKKFDVDLCQRAKGLPMRPMGHESLLSAGAGHFAAAARACKANCRTPFKNIATAYGFLYEELGRRDKRAGRCVAEGWNWRASIWHCEVARSGMPDLCQRALSAMHGVSPRSAALETTVWLSDLQSDKGDAIAAASAASPLRASRIEAVARLIDPVSGPVPHFLDKFSKTLGENKALGEELIASIATAELNNYDNAPFFRAALAATNLAPEKVAGVAGLIYGADVEQPKSKAETTQLNSAFTARAAPFNVERLQRSPDKKGGSKAWAAGDAVADLQGLGQVNEPPERVGAETSEKERTGRATFDEMRRAPTRALEGRAETEIGSQVGKKNTVEGQLFEVTAVDDDGAVSTSEVRTFNADECPQVSVDYKALISDWEVIEEQVSEKCAAQDCAMSALAQDRLRRMISRSNCEEQVGLIKSGSLCEGPPLFYMENPCGPATPAAVGKNVLKFAPTVPLQNITCCKEKGGLEGNLEAGGKGGGFFAPRWWVGPAAAEEKANVKFAKVVGADGASSPALQDFAPLKVHERLYFYKPKDARQALQNATAIGAGGDSGRKGGAAGQGKDKPKKDRGGKGSASSGGGKPSERVRKA